MSSAGPGRVEDVGRTTATWALWDTSVIVQPGVEKVTARLYRRESRRPSFVPAVEKDHDTQGDQARYDQRCEQQVDARRSDRKRHQRWRKQYARVGRHA